MRWDRSKARVLTTTFAAVAGCLLLSATVSASAQGSAAVTMTTSRSSAPEVHAPVPKIDWQPCRGNPRLECAHIKVPLDYDNPNGPKITLFASMRPADDPQHRIGSLFVNPGGPGGSAAEFTGYAAHLLGKPVRAQFDVIGVDPRGVANSAPVDCRAQAGDPPLPPHPRVAFPRGPRQTEAWFKYDIAERALCSKRGTAILDHMTTADTARDMDLIRQAVGDSQLTYYGISYGTMLGSTYAAMFPGRVRAMVIDGVLDPVQWTTGRFDLGQQINVSARLRSGYGAWEALTSAFSECDRVGVHRCKYAGRIGAEWNKLIAKLHDGAVRVGRQRVTYADVYGNILGGLYDARAYPSILDAIHQLYQEIFAPSPRQTALTAQAWARLQQEAKQSVPPRYGPAGSSIAGDDISPQFEGVLCSDSVNPRSEHAAIPSAHFANQQGPGFGALWSWASSVCPNWPGSSADAFQGPWRTRTAHPIVITGNLHDPATPISGARAVNKLFAGSRLITVNLWGHGALGHSLCATTKWDAYFVSGRLPAPGLVCQADHSLFPPH